MSLTSRTRALLLFALALAVRLPMLITQHDAYLAGGITTALGLVARNVVEGRGLAETTGPQEILHLYDRQLGEGRLIDIRDFPNPPNQTTKPLIQRMPGYPLLLALIWKVTGDHRYLPIQILQVFLSALLPLILYGAGRRLFGETAGLMAGVLSALNLAEARIAVAPLYDGWLIFLTCFLLWLLIRSGERGYPLSDFAWMGLALAAGVYLKSTVLAIPVLVAAALVPRISFRRAAARGAILLGLPLLALLPWAQRNQMVFHRPILTNTFFWATIWEGFGEVPNPFGAVLNDRETYSQAVEEQPMLEYATPAYDDYFRPKVLAAVSGRPDFVVLLMVRRLIRGLFFPANPWGMPSVEGPESSFSTYRAQTGGGHLSYLAARPATAAVKLLQRVWDPFLVILALLTLVVDRNRWREFLPILALPAAFLVATIPLHLEGRYLLPGSLVWILFAAVPPAAWLGARGSAPEARSNSSPVAL